MQDDSQSASRQHDKYEDVPPTPPPRDRNDLPVSSSEQRIPTHTVAYLDSLSELAGRSFASTQESIIAILRLIVEQLGLRSSFLTHISREKSQNEVMAAHNLTGGSGIQEGALLELPQTF